MEYSAGLLDYFFRGTLGVSVARDGSGNYTITVQNTSGQDFGGGSLYLFQDDESGNRTLVTNLSNTLLPNLGTTNMTLASPGTNKCILVYQGTIGVTNGTDALDPVDAGIGIAAASVTFSTNGIIYAEEPVEWYLAIASSYGEDGGIPFRERLLSTSSSFNGNNGDYSAPIYFRGQYICGFWCILPKREHAYDVTVNFNSAYFCYDYYYTGQGYSSGDVYHVGANQNGSFCFISEFGFNSVDATLIY